MTLQTVKEPAPDSADFDALFDASPPGGIKNAAPVVGTESGAVCEAGRLQQHKYSDGEAESILDKPLDLTRFPTMGAKRKEGLHLSLRELAAEIEGHRAPSKESLPWYKLATFGEHRTEKGSLRNNANVLFVTGVEADYDAGTMSLDEAERRLREANVAGLLYTTAKHTDEAPRWRVFAPLSEACSPEARTALMERLNGVMDGTLDGASFTLSQSYYAGSIDGLPPIAVRLVDGRPIDRAADLDAIALPKGMCRKDGEATDDKDKSGSGALFALACRIRESYGSIDDLRKALASDANALAAAHVAKEEKASRGRGERAILRAWNRAPEPVDDFDDLPDLPETGSTSTLRFLSPGECADAPAREYIVKGFLSAGDVACIYGAPGAGKSLISPHMGYAVAQGRHAFGMRTKPGRVFYVAAEDPHGMRGRVSALKMRHGDADSFTLVEGVSDLLSTDSGDLKALLAAVAQMTPSLIFIDTLAMAFPGLEENSAEAMGRVVAVARKLTAHGAAVVLIHHDTKAGTPTPRGHSLLNGALDVALQLFARDENGIVRGKLSKNRNGSCDRDIAFRIGVESMGYDDDGDPVTYAICNELDGAAAKPSIKLTPSERAALTILTDMLAMSGECPVTEEQWRQRCVDARTVSAAESRDSRYKATKRAFEGLSRKGAVIIVDGHAKRPDIAVCDVDLSGDAFGDLEPESEA